MIICPAEAIHTRTVPRSINIQLEIKTVGLWAGVLNVRAGNLVLDTEGNAYLVYSDGSDFILQSVSNELQTYFVAMDTIKKWWRKDSLFE